MRLHLNNILILLFFFPVAIYCQPAKHSAQLDTAPATGFYSITINPGLSRYLQADYRDLRIVDNRNTQVPYILQTALPALNTTSFHSFPILAFPILENSIKDSGNTQLVLENISHAPVRDIALVIRNTSVTRMAKISGSDDLRHWFAITDNTILQPGELSGKDKFVLNFVMPPSSYKYFRITINNGKNDPLNIIEGGQYISFDYKSINRYLVNPAPAFAQKDSSDGNSYIRVVQDAPYHINGIRLHLAGPRLFKRKIELVSGRQLVVELSVVNDTAFQFYIPTINDREFLIKLYNGDNPPLVCKAIETTQELVKAIAYLEENKQYKMLLDDPSAAFPRYDLQDLKDSIPQNAPELKYHGSVTAIAASPATVTGESQWKLWLIIIGVLILLSFFTWNLTREMNKRS